tara:strand:- start:2450 stop:3169 length:720 start_codon:yes stop_codon:yes gene_type:complete
MVIIKGDIHKVIKTLESNSIDLLYVNPPFAMTGAEWDKALDWNVLWTDIWRVVKNNGAVVIHSTQRFTMLLASSQLKNFRYKYTWVKNTNTNFFLCKKQPLRRCEDVLVFYKEPPTYNPQMIGDEFHKKRVVMYGGKEKYYGNDKAHTDNWGHETNVGGHNGRYPNDLLEYSIKKGKGNASTRPNELIEFFIKTYSNKGDAVLDITCYGAETGIVCDYLEREYIGIDLDPQVEYDYTDF